MSLLSGIISSAARAHEFTRADCRAAARAAREKGGLGDAVASSPGGTTGLNWSRYSQTSQHNADQYGYFTGYPYAIINNIANRLAAQPIRVAKVLKAGSRARRRFAVKSKDFLPKNLQDFSSRLEIYPTHPIITAIDNPNPIMVRHTLLYSTFASQEITGRGHWWMSKNAETGRLEIWPVPSHWIEAHHEPEQLFAYYRVTLPGTGEPIKVPTKQIVPFIFPDPSDPFGVLAPLQANARSVMSDFAIELSQRMSFENGINPGLAIVVGKPPEFAGVAGDQMILTKDQRDQLISAVRRQYRGVTRFDEPLILDALIKDVKPITTSPREMAYRESSPLIRGRLTQGWGMNPIVLGEMENVNYASSGVADHHVCRNVFGVRTGIASQSMTCYIPPYALGRPGGEDGGVVIYMEPVRPEDPEMEMTKDYEDFDRGIISRNDLRRKRGLEPIPGGDFAFIQGSQDQGGGWVQVDPDAEQADEEDKPVIYIPPNPNKPGADGGLSSDEEDEADDFGADDEDEDEEDGKRTRTRRRKVRDDEGHDHGSDGRFTGPGGGAGGGTDADRHDTGKVDDHPDSHTERARGLASEIAKHGKKAVKVAKQVGKLAAGCGYWLLNTAMSVSPDDIGDNVYDYSKIINAKGTGDWLSTHLGVGGNAAAVVASHVLAYGLTKMKQYIAKRKKRDGDGGKRFRGGRLKLKTRRNRLRLGRRDGDGKKTNHDAAVATQHVLRQFEHALGCPEDQLPTVREVEEWLDKGKPDGKGNKLGAGVMFGGDTRRVGEWVRAAAAAVDLIHESAISRWRKGLEEVFAKLGAKSAALVREYCRHESHVSPAEAAAGAVNRAEWEAEITRVVRGLVEASAAEGASAEWHFYRLSRRRRAMKSGQTGPDPAGTPPPPRGVLNAVRGVADKVMDQGPVKTIVDGVIGLVRGLFSRGKKAGKKGPELADAVNAGAFEGAAPARHAEGVTRNEAASAVNAGQAAVRDQLAKAGKVVVSEWVTRADEKVRPAHRAMNGQRVRPGRAFRVPGGHHAYYPGDLSLPPALRCRCRCKCVTIYTDGV